MKRIVFILIVVSLVSGISFLSTSCGKTEGQAVLGCKMADKWKTVQDFQYQIKDEKDSKALGIIATKDGTLIAVGAGAGNSTWLSENIHFIMQKSYDKGLTWETVEESQYAPGFTSVTTTSVFVQNVGAPESTIPIIEDKNGYLYYVYAAQDGEPNTTTGMVNSHWIVKKSIDGGKTWAKIDDFLGDHSLGHSGAFGADPCKYSLPYDIAVDSNGLIFVVGNSSIANGSPCFIQDNITGCNGAVLFVRKSSNGSQFDTVYQFQGVATGISVGTGIGIDSKNQIFISASSQVGSYINWITRKSKDNGATWFAAEAYTNQGSRGSQARDIYIDKNDHIYTVGAVNFNDSAYNFKNAFWSVRKSIDGGTTWETVDRFQLEDGLDARAIHITADKEENIYVSGYAVANAHGARQWIVRKSSNKGLNWHTIDNYYAHDGQNATATSFTSDSTGNLYTAGYAYDENGKSHWIVRKLACE